MAQGNGEEVAWLDTLIRAVREGHDRILVRTGGLGGTQPGELEAIVARPFHSMFGEPFYGSIDDMAAALFHGIIRGHPFVDGNKRAAVIAVIGFLHSLRYFGEDSSVTRDQVAKLRAIATITAEGLFSVEEIALCLGAILRSDAEPVPIIPA